VTFKRIAILLFTAVLCLCLTTCEKCGVTEPDSGIPIALTFDIYSHIKGFEKSISKEVESGSAVVISINDLDVEDVDEDRIAIRGSDFSELVVFDKTGEASFTAPEESTRYNIILFNTILGLDYSMMDQQGSVLYNGARHYVVFRKDFDGHPIDWIFGFSEEKPWRLAFKKINEVLDRGWVRWGSFQRKPAPNDALGDFSYGYSECHGFMGWHTGQSISVNACLLSEFNTILAICNAEIFENVTSVDNNGIDGGGGSYDVMTDESGFLNEIGEHLLVYVFAKDAAPVN
jgi:hypothetical protein